MVSGISILVVVPLGHRRLFCRILHMLDWFGSLESSKARSILDDFSSAPLVVSREIITIYRGEKATSTVDKCQEPSSLAKLPRLIC